jgi:hypothetical protein
MIDRCENEIQQKCEANVGTVCEAKCCYSEVDWRILLSYRTVCTVVYSTCHSISDEPSVGGKQPLKYSPVIQNWTSTSSHKFK